MSPYKLLDDSTATLLDSRAVDISAPTFDRDFLDRKIKKMTNAINSNAAIPPPMAPPITDIDNEASSFIASAGLLPLVASESDSQPDAESANRSQPVPMSCELTHRPSEFDIVEHHLQPPVTTHALHDVGAQSDDDDDAEVVDNNAPMFDREADWGVVVVDVNDDDPVVDLVVVRVVAVVDVVVARVVVVVRVVVGTTNPDGTSSYTERNVFPTRT